ncbi:MAG: hypothetical protein Q9190_000734 [Brigantiaea leucoxantha]
MNGAHYSPPWSDTSIIGIAGSSGSGKTSLAIEIVSSLSLPWVVILAMDSFYKILTPEQQALAHRNEYDLDVPKSIDFDLLFERLKDLKQGKSFGTSKIEEGIWKDALSNGSLSSNPVFNATYYLSEIQRVSAFVDMQKIEIKRLTSQDIIVPRSIDNRVAIDMVVKHIQRLLIEKSKRHQNDLKKLGEQVEDEPLSDNVLLLEQTRQLVGITTIIQNPLTDEVDFIFYFDRISTLLVEKALENLQFEPKTVTTPRGSVYHGLGWAGVVSAVVILRGGSCLETGLKRVIPDCQIGRVLVQSNYRTGEPELHYLHLPQDISTHSRVLLLDPQVSSGGAALMCCKVLVDHGVQAERIVFVTYSAGKVGVNRLLKVFPEVTVVVCRIVEDSHERWIESRYFGC